ncbi:MAG: hypothetical protein KA170_02845 [Candidatus Promineofilum sp.]|nr:hypothetical protein [Promineifilum sp.]
MSTWPIFPATRDWLLDPETPGPRYLTLREVLRAPPGSPELRAASAAAHREGPIAAILDAMEPEGYWGKAGPGYGPKYYSTVWSIIALGQLGASVAEDERAGRACAYLLDHALAPGGQFSCNRGPAGTFDCLQGNLIAALLDLGGADPRLDAAFDWMARTVTGAGMAGKEDRDAPLRFYGYKSGPLFRCRANNDLSCAWGAAKVMLAFAKLPPSRRTPLIDDAIGQGIDFLLAGEPAAAPWPSGYAERPSGNWWKFGFPVFYIADLLQVAEALAGLGYGGDPRLAPTLALIAAKADGDGRWPLEYHYNGKMWPGVSFGRKGQPNKWVTIRALRVLAMAGDAAGTHSIRA